MGASAAVSNPTTSCAPVIARTLEVTRILATAAADRALIGAALILRLQHLLQQKLIHQQPLAL